MIPILYEGTETEFTSQGLGSLSDATSCTISEEINNTYELEMNYPMTGVHFFDIKVGRIILATPAPRKESEPFSIYKISKPIDGIVTIYAEHISYRLSYIPVKPFSASNCYGALNGCVENSLEDNPFTVWTDKALNINFSFTKPQSFRLCLGGVEGSILDTYRGEYEFNRFTVKLHTNRGSLKDTAKIIYGKNLTDLKQENTIILISNDRETPYSNINRILNGHDKFITLEKTDTVCFAEPSYDAYEKLLVKILNDLAIKGVNIVQIPKDKSVRHHASSEDLRLLIKLFNPKYYMPIKGEYRYQVQNGNLAYSVGIPKENILLKENGDVVTILDGELKENFDRVFVDDILIDGNFSEDVGDVVLKDRELLSNNGLVVISSTLSKKDKSMIIDPEIITRGFIYSKENTEIINEIKRISTEIIKNNTFSNKYADYVKIRNDIREQVGQYLYKETQCKPVILTVIQEI